MGHPISGGITVGTMAYLFAAYAIIWVAALLYSYSISARQSSLEREIAMLRDVVAEREEGSGSN